MGHPEQLRTIVDVAFGCDKVWAVGGYPHYVIPISYDELLRITAGVAAQVAVH